MPHHAATPPDAAFEGYYGTPRHAVVALEGGVRRCGGVVRHHSSSPERSADCRWLADRPRSHWGGFQMGLARAIR